MYMNVYPLKTLLPTAISCLFSSLLFEDYRTLLSMSQTKLEDLATPDVIPKQNGLPAIIINPSILSCFVSAWILKSWVWATLLLMCGQLYLGLTALKIHQSVSISIEDTIVADSVRILRCLPAVPRGFRKL